jgi:sortase A
MSDSQTQLRRRSVLDALFTCVLSLAVGVLFFGLFAFVLSGVQEARSQRQLLADFRGLVNSASPVAPPLGGRIPPGLPVAVLWAPRANIADVAVVEGTSSADLRSGPGLLASSPLPGQPGESVIMGTSVTAGAPFGSIASLRKDDIITVRTAQGRLRFRVIDLRVAGQRIPSLPSSGSLLTLVSETGKGFLGNFGANQLVYVDAALVGRAKPAPPGRPRTVPADEVQGANDPSAWLDVSGWLFATIIASLAIRQLYLRWDLRRAWLLGAPVLVAIYWLGANEALRLLPNVY